MKAFEVAEILEQFAPLDTASDWDNTGFCIGSPDTEVKGVLVGFDCTPELIREAMERGANMVITHHPLIFRGVKKISPDSFIGSIITLAVKNDIVVYSAHTNADKAEGGVNTLMAERLGLRGCSVLSQDGFGMTGYLPAPMSSLEFIAMVKRQFSLKTLRCSRPIDENIVKVALCSGSGSSLIQEALESGAQAYVCGDLSYHQFFAEKGFMLLDIGHFESEIEIVDKLISVLEEKISTFAILRTKQDNNPVFYF